MIAFVKSAAILLAAGSAAIATVPAQAGTQFGDARSLEVRHADLDLTSDAGVGALNRRIAAAARMVCGSFDPADLAAKTRAKACRRQAVADAQPKAEVPIAAARTGEQLAGGFVAAASNP